MRGCKPHGLWFPVDVSTSAQATLGGMAGNNSCGSRSIAYGNMVHNVLADRCAARGRHARRASGRSRRWTRAPAACARADAARCARSASASGDEIETRVPKVLRRVGGYNLDVFHPQSERPYTADGSVNYAHLLVGSEGTLAWSRALTLKLLPLPAHRALGVVSFPTLYQAMEVREAHRDARAVRGRARRPHDDRTRAQQSGVPADHRRRAGRRARRDPAGRVHRRGRSGASPPPRRAGRADGRSRAARSGRPHHRCRRAEGAVGRAQGRAQHHDEHEGRRQAGVVHRGLRGAARAPRRLRRPADAGLRAARHARHLVRARVGRHAARAADPRHARATAPRRCARSRKRPPRMVREYKGAFSGEHGDGLVRSEWVGVAVRPAPDPRVRGGQGAVRPATANEPRQDRARDEDGRRALFRYSARLSPDAAGRPRSTGRRGTCKRSGHRVDRRSGQRRRSGAWLRQGRRDVQQQRPLPQVRRGNDVPELIA